MVSPRPDRPDPSSRPAEASRPRRSARLAGQLHQRGRASLLGGFYPLRRLRHLLPEPLDRLDPGLSGGSTRPHLLERADDPDDQADGEQPGSSRCPPRPSTKGQDCRDAGAGGPADQAASWSPGAPPPGARCRRPPPRGRLRSTSPRRGPRHRGGSPAPGGALVAVATSWSTTAVSGADSHDSSVVRTDAGVEGSSSARRTSETTVAGVASDAAERRPGRRAARSGRAAPGTVAAEPPRPRMPRPIRSVATVRSSTVGTISAGIAGRCRRAARVADPSGVSAALADSARRSTGRSAPPGPAARRSRLWATRRGAATQAAQPATGSRSSTGRHTAPRSSPSSPNRTGRGGPPDPPLVLGQLGVADQHHRQQVGDRRAVAQRTARGDHERVRLRRQRPGLVESRGIGPTLDESDDARSSRTGASSPVRADPPRTLDARRPARRSPPSPSDARSPAPRTPPAPPGRRPARRTRRRRPTGRSVGSRSSRTGWRADCSSRWVCELALDSRACSPSTSSRRIRSRPPSPAQNHCQSSVMSGAASPGSDGPI